MTVVCGGGAALWGLSRANGDPGRLSLTISFSQRKSCVFCLCVISLKCQATCNYVAAFKSLSAWSARLVYVCRVDFHMPVVQCIVLAGHATSY